MCDVLSQDIWENIIRRLDEKSQINMLISNKYFLGLDIGDNPLLDDNCIFIELFNQLGSQYLNIKKGRTLTFYSPAMLKFVSMGFPEKSLMLIIPKGAMLDLAIYYYRRLINGKIKDKLLVFL